jgi:uncharacterized protein
MTPALVVLIAFAALAGTARIGLFALNRMIFGQREEHPTMNWALVGIPPALGLLSLLYIPLYRAIFRGEESTLALPGALWLTLTAATGIYWLLDRTLQLRRRPPVAGVRSISTQLIRLRKAHIPFASLRKLGAHNDVYDLEVTRHQIVIPDLPPQFDGYRIGFVSDTHVASFHRRAFFREVANQLRLAEVDLILLGGDFITWQRHIPLMAEVLVADLEAPDGKLAVLGNHDYWAGADEVVAAMTVKGVRFIINRSVRIERDGAAISVAGIDEIYRGKPDVEAALRGIPEDEPRIVVSHHPDIIDHIGGQRVDLLLCGHTHGGQIRLPFFGALVIPSIHEARYDAGFFRVRRTLMYVGRGVGSVPPLRILCRPELPLFELVVR